MSLLLLLIFYMYNVYVLGDIQTTISVCDASNKAIKNIVKCAGMFCQEFNEMSKWLDLLKCFSDRKFS